MRVDLAASTGTGVVNAYGIENVNGGKAGDIIRGSKYANVILRQRRQ